MILFGETAMNPYSSSLRADLTQFRNIPKSLINSSLIFHAFLIRLPAFSVPFHPRYAHLKIPVYLTVNNLDISASQSHYIVR